MLSTRLGTVRMVFVLAVSLVGAAQTQAQSTSPVSNISIETEFEYQQFRNAVSGALYLQVDFLLVDRHRALASVAGLMAFATNNPLAEQEDFEHFLGAYDALLIDYQFRGGIDTDRDLNLSTNLLGAIRRHSRVNDPALAGFDTRILEDVFELLGIVIPDPFDFNGLQERTRSFESARLAQIGGSPEVTELLVVALFGSDLNGAPRDGLAFVVEDYLMSEGFSVTPDPVDPRYEGTTNALEDLPETYAEYLSVLDQFGDPLAFDPLNPPHGGTPNEVAEVDAASAMVINSDLYSQILTCLDNIAGDNEGEGTPSAFELVLAQIQADLDDPERPTILEAIELAEDPASVAARFEEVTMTRLAIAEDRATADWASLLMLQSEQQVANTFGSSVREYSKIPTMYYDDAAKIGAIQDYVVTLGSAAIAGASKDAGGVYDAVLSGVSQGARIGEVFSGRPVPLTPEEMLYNQGVEIRNQISDLTQLVEDRFRNIDQQLLVISDNLNTEFSNIGDSLEELTSDVNGVVETLSIQGAQLDRIEDALWGVGTDLLTADFAIVSNDVLNRSNLPYDQGSPNFASDLSEFFTRATVVALNSTYAGPMIPSLTFDSATDQLFSQTFDANDQSLIRIDPIGRLLNDLRQFPTILDNDPDVGPLTNLGSLHVVGGAPWAQAAVAHTRLARNNPWYFKARLDGIGLINGYTGLDDIIAEGQLFDEMTKAGRDQTLFDELFAGYNRSVLDIVNAQEEALARAGSLGRCEEPYAPAAFALSIDLFSGLAQPQLSAQLFPLTGPLGDRTLPGPPRLRDTGDFETGNLEMPNDVSGWNLVSIPDTPGGHTEHLVQLVTAFDYTDGQCGGMTQGGVTARYNFQIKNPGVPSQVTLFFTFTGSYLAPDGTTSDAEITRALTCTVTRNGSPFNFFSEEQLEMLFSDDLPFWRAFRDGIAGVEEDSLLNGANLTGRTISHTSSLEGDLDFFIQSDGVGTLIRLVDDGGGGFIEISDRDLLMDRVLSMNSQAWALLDGTTPGTLATAITDAQDDAMNWVSLIDGYTTLALPRLMEGSDVVRSGLRGTPIINNMNYANPDSINLRVDAVDFFTRNRLNPDTAGRIDSRFGERSARVQEEVDFAIQTPDAEGHGYVEYVLAELRDLRDNAGKLAIDDCYLSDGTTMMVNTTSGLLANDVAQANRTTTVDLASVTDPAGGVLSVSPDGSFTYTPDPGTTADSFTYRAKTDVYLMGESGFPGTTLSNVATVKIKMTPDPITISVPIDQPTIQAAIDAIESGPANTILVHPGVYTEALNSLGKSFTLRSIAGANSTTIANVGSGQNLLIIGESVTGVVTIEGFTLSGAVGSQSAFSGAIEHDSRGTLRLVDSIVRDNERSGLFSGRGIVDVSGCTFEDNASVRGGAMWIESLTGARSFVNITDSTFNNNMTRFFDTGAVEPFGGFEGGAIAAKDAIVAIERCVFDSNFGDALAGGVMLTGSAFAIDRSEFRNNSGNSGGGAVAIFEDSSGSVTNSLFVQNNSISSFGGAISLFDCRCDIAGCTFADNSGTNELAIGFFAVLPGNATFSNCISWNSATSNSVALPAGAINYSLIDGASFGASIGDGVISIDPMFAGPDDYRLSPMSPAIDAGNNALDLGRPLDLSGEARRIDDPDVVDTGQGMAPVVDMGAYEYTEDVPVNSCVFDFDNDGDVDLGDFGVFGASFNSMTGDMNFNPAADADNDGDVDLGDFGVFGSQFGRTDCLD